ncbi:peptidoglycan editing factor PgeF [Pseudalkalibacillus salsuginis]|uniref:peptidoglycan editing factor PgeF n=1 Tax=Pseudalkalibacillus salsuginis TaxID=2910972 RepID=UPI001F1B8ADC|nr:peptidoglycan editing factor PgeF [Pseudalkalibacillus salsuginis]MCF6410485.1 peptidoglycan editing factor PgeF [Pseudalkalibacillus salsuginis]
MADPFTLEHRTYYGIEKTLDKVTAGFSTRHGGVSQEPFRSLNLGLHVNDDVENIIENRRRLAEAIGTQLNQWVFAHQVHDNQIQKVGQNDKGKGSNSYNSGMIGKDGLYTKENDIVLALAYADCVPIYFFSNEVQIAGIAHAGWKGTVKGIAPRMIETWVNEENVPVESVHVVVGPSIHHCCYEVDQRVISQVDDALERVDDRPYTSKGDYKYQLNLQQLNKQLLMKIGVLEENIRITSLCTSCNVNEFFSHRKEKGSTGRMLGFIKLDH